MRILGLLKSTLYYADIKTKLTAYKTLSRPLLKYSSAACDPYLKNDVDSIKMVQNRAVRSIVGLRGMVGVSEETEEIGLESLVKRRKDFRINSMIKIFQNKELHPSLVEYFTQYQGYRLQEQLAINIPRAQRINGDQFLYSFMPRTMRDLRPE